jgi:hypothetical protein
MKRGFRLAADGTVVVLAEQVPLYAGVPPRILRQLCDGFGDTLLAALERDGGACSEADLVGLGPNVVGELRSLFQMLDDLI